MKHLFHFRTFLGLWVALWLFAWVCGADLLPHLGLHLDVHGHNLPAEHPADPAHPFADHRRLWGVPNAMDVLSNIPFVLLGLWGLARTRQALMPASTQASLRLLWWGMVLTGAGSACYHWAPSVATLVADRMGMAVAFAGMLSLTGSASQTDVWHQGARLALCGVGLASATLPLVNGNMAPWLVLQFGGVLWLAWVAIALRTLQPILPVSYGWVVLAYGVAKLLELHDADAWQLSHHGLAGHTLKHLMAAAAVLPVLVAVKGCGRIPR